MEEWIVDQFFRTLDEFGLKKPWYWDIFQDELEIYHHMIYASAYTYRATSVVRFCDAQPHRSEMVARRNILNIGTIWMPCGTQVG